MEEELPGGSRAASLAEMSADALSRVCASEDRYYRHEEPGKFALSLLRSMEAIPALDLPLNIFRHSLQAASRCLHEGEQEELVVVALLHDVGECFSPANHGAVAAAILSPFVSEENAWLVENHAVFQEFYFADKLGRDHLGRECFRGHPYFEATLRFCERWDQVSFDAVYQEQPLAVFEPMVRRVFARQPRRGTPGR